jgi:2'-5' RNA ligase
MRLFIAVNFNTETQSKLLALQNELRTDSKKGRFSSPENLHLTLVFLGECDEKEAAYAKSAMDEVEFEPFAINIARTGCFKRSGGDVWWAGIKNNKELTELHKKLTKKLTEFGFQIEKRKFSPHITLGREIVTNASPRSFEEFGQTVDKIKLMKSERIAGKLTYTAIHKKHAR